MGLLIGLPLLALLAVLQSTLLRHLQLLDGRPDLVLLAVVAWSLTGRTEEAMIWGFFGGLFMDLLSGIPFGSSAMALVLVAALASLLEGRFWEAHLLMPLGVMLAASVLYHALALGTILLMGRSIDFNSAALRVILPSAFLNLVLALPATQLAVGLKQRLFPEKVAI
jgi:rod shape-determining protein MreD